MENALLINKNKKDADDITELDIRRMMSPEINRTAPLTGTLLSAAVLLCLRSTNSLIENVTFNASKTWLGYEKTEKIGDDAWKAKIYEFEGFDLRVS